MIRYRWWPAIEHLIAHPYLVWARSSTPIFLPIFVLLAGLSALIFGNNAAKSFADLGVSYAIRIVGTAMVIGSAMVLISFIRRNILIETLGLTIAAFGTATYGAFTIVALWPTQGLVSGLGYLGITGVLLNRVYLIVTLTEAHRGLDRHNNE